MSAVKPDTPVAAAIGQRQADYVAHVVVGAEVLAAARRLENPSTPFAVACAAAFCMIAIAFADVWRRHFNCGPLEALMCALTDPRGRRTSISA